MENFNKASKVIGSHFLLQKLILFVKEKKSVHTEPKGLIFYYEFIMGNLNDLIVRARDCNLNFLGSNLTGDIGGFTAGGK